MYFSSLVPINEIFTKVFFHYLAHIFQVWCQYLERETSYVCALDLFIFELFLILIWLRSVFEADFYTDPKSRTFFCLGERFPCYAMISDPTLKKKVCFTLEGAVFKISLIQ